jgi:hypothetical protein
MRATIRFLPVIFICNCMLGIGAASAGDVEKLPSGQVHSVGIPQGVAPETSCDTSVINTRPNSLRPELLRAVMAWLATEFHLQPIDDLPDVEFVPVGRMIDLRYRDVPSDRWSNEASGAQPDIVAIYDNRAQTIFLPEGWSGRTQCELSVLVHELVHHVQNVTGQKFACDEDREALAFAAQEKWLGLFGSNLEMEFDLDPFTLLVRTHCPY